VDDDPIDELTPEPEGPDTDAGEGVELSSIASIGNVVISSGEFSLTIDSNEAFVRNGIDSISFSIEYMDTDAVLLVNSAPLNNPYALDVDLNSFRIVVKSEDGMTSASFDLFVIRAPQYVYVTNVNTSGYDELFLYSIDPDDGTLVAQNTSTESTGEDPYDIALSPDHNYLYVANSVSNTQSMYAIDHWTGGLTPLTPSTVAQGSTPYGTVIHPNGMAAYSANGGDAGPGTIAQFDRNPDTGLLTAMSSPTVTMGDNAWFVALVGGGEYLYATQFGSFGDSNNDSVWQYNIDSDTGALTSMTTSSVASEDKPWYIIVDPSSRYAYVSNYGTGSISQYSISATDGSLSALTPASVSVGSNPIGIAIDPSGRFLYVANSTSDTISMFSIDQANGTLSAIGSGTIVASPNPYGLATDRQGKYLYAALSGSNQVAMFAIDASSGALSPLSPATIEAGTNPRFIVVAD
jgi:6-phosphogluconolactonase (cycloisomerase 2 family)